MTAPLSILYDGWSLLYNPASPAALHLAALLAYLPPEEIEPVLVLPGTPPTWLPPGISTQVLPTPDRPLAHLDWEQRRLPLLTRRLGIQALHYPSPASPLFWGPPCVYSPTGIGANDISKTGKNGLELAERLRQSIAQGGMSHARGVFWPADIPPPSLPAPVLKIPPLVHPAFFSGMASRPVNAPGDPFLNQLPPEYVLYHGSYTPHQMLDLMDAWSWVAGSLGQAYPLILLGASEKEQLHVNAMLPRLNLEGTVIVLPTLPTMSLPEIYRRCTAVFQPASEPPWNGPVRHALACGKPVVAKTTPISDSLVGAAAYLVAEKESRGKGSPPYTRLLGAALLSVLVDENVKESLSLAAQSKAQGWRTLPVGEALNSAYRTLLKPISRAGRV